ncbi:MAG: FtsX-like permease family protein [Bacteroidia bacterium]|nr:FtsX-like permease family protein [Bacteroidia bacterium]
MADGKRNVTPPRWPRKMLELYASAVAIEDLTGDMDELFHENLKRMTPARARRKYWSQALALLFSYGLKRRRKSLRKQASSSSFFHASMLKSYYVMGVRNLVRQRTFAVINLVCLSIGMSIGLLALAAYVDYKGVDSFHSNRDAIYRVVTDVDNKTRRNTYAASSQPLALKLQEDVAGIDQVVRINRNFNLEVETGANSQLPLRGYYADAGFFGMFSFNLKYGNAATALDKPFTVVLSEEAAKKIFGDKNPLGETMTVGGKGDFEVTGVVAPHGLSHLNFDALASFSTLNSLEAAGQETGLGDWGPVTMYYTYLRVGNPGAIAQIETVLGRMADERNKADTDNVISYGLQSLRDIPSGSLNMEIGPEWGTLSMAVFFALAMLVLLPACFNYTNITIARALTRAKEIGLRKVAGGESRHVFLQLLSETLIISLLALVGSIGIFLLIRSEFLSMIVMGTKTFTLQITTATALVFFLFAVATGLLAGFFPALYFSRLNPIETLRNASLSGGLSKIKIRKALIVLQFALSMVFILGVAIMARQYRYVLTYDFGFQKENILDIEVKDVNTRVLKTELQKLPEVSTVSFSSFEAGNWINSNDFVRKFGDEDSLQVFQMYIDEDYITNHELKLLAGANFTGEAASRKSIIVNEQFLKIFNIAQPALAIGQDFGIGDEAFKVVGVVKDFNFMPLREQITSFMFRYDPSQAVFANVKLTSTDLHATMMRLGETWERLSDKPFEARFLEDVVEESLASFNSMLKIFGFLGLLAITISCLGLLAVVVSATESRVRELGLRKIMGATGVRPGIGARRQVYEVDSDCRDHRHSNHLRHV